MTNYNSPSEGKDPELWKIAQKRAKFKNHFSSYLVTNIILWAIWYFTTGRHLEHFQGRYPWPMWVTFFWGIGLALNFIDAYIFPKPNSVEKEYDKLKNKNNNL